MLKNFFKTAVRTILKNQSYAIINFIGLTCGISLALLVLTYVRSEMSFDRFHTKADRLYRMSYAAPGGGLQLARTPPPIAPRMKEYFPEVENAARVYFRDVSMSRAEGEESFEQQNVAFVDSSFIDMFTVEFVNGDHTRALRDKFTVLITEETAKKYFGDANAVGESLLFAGKHSFRIAAVIKNFPENSHLRFDMLVPYDNMFDLESEQTSAVLRQNLDVNYIISHSYTYVLLKEGATPENINANMGAFLKKYALPRVQVGQVFSLMPVTDIHLKSTLLIEPSPTNSMNNLYIFIAVGILTILIACINYINLSTAQSFTRIKEIGIRKILGSMKGHLIMQFLAESFLFCAGAIVMSFLILDLTLPLLNSLTNKNLEFREVVDNQMMLSATGLLIFVTITAGGYPAYFVTRFNSVNSLKGQGTASHGSQMMRRVLVVFQLMVACMLLSGSFLVVRQLNFLTERPLGFQREHVITIELFSNNLNGIFRQNDSTFSLRLQTFRDAIQTQTGVKGTTLSSNAPGLGAIFRGTIPEGFTREDNLFIANVSVDYDFLESYGMKIIAGRNFDRRFPSDMNEGYIVNESAVREFKWGSPENALGKEILVEGKKGKVIGVINDYNFASLTQPVSAMILGINPNQFNTLSIRFENSNVPVTIEKIESEWKRMFPEKAFAYTFLDEQLNSQYRTFRDFGTIIKTFALIAMIISCLGVYGLVLFIVQRKVKEIGVRKVLGATVLHILNLIYRDFAWLLVIGFVLAVPVSYYFIYSWLENFTYRTDIDPLSYLISFFMVLLIVFVTISYQAIKASLSNPVNSLRSE